MKFRCGDCDKTYKHKYAQKHIEECGLKERNCLQGCDLKAKFKGAAEMRDHLENLCAKTLFTCFYCEEVLTRVKIISHDCVL